MNLMRLPNFRIMAIADKRGEFRRLQLQSFIFSIMLIGKLQNGLWHCNPVWYYNFFGEVGRESYISFSYKGKPVPSKYFKELGLVKEKKK